MIDSIYNASAGTITRGRATDIGNPKIAMAKAGDGFTLAHEIGHGKFSLRHPDNDTLHLIPKKEEMDDAPGPGPYKYPDKNNFMYHNSYERINRIRHYQWKKILSGKYNY